MKKKAQQEEIHLDEALEEETSPTDSRTSGEGPERVDSEEEEKSGENAKDGEGDGADGAESRKGLGGFLRKKRLWLGCIGILAGLLGLTFGYGKWAHHHDGAHELLTFIGEGGKKATASGYTPLMPFYVPLPEGSENIAVRLDISVKWRPQSRELYQEHLTPVRDEVFQFLLKAAQSEKDFEKKKSHLESELSTVFQHALALKKVEVRLDKITPI